MEKLTIRGETFFFDAANKILQFTIREPFFSAGKQFGWLGQTIGLGINEDALNFALKHNCKLRVKVGDINNRVYEVDPAEWMQFAYKTKSIMVKGSTKLLIAQWTPALFKSLKQLKMFPLQVWQPTQLMIYRIPL